MKHRDRSAPGSGRSGPAGRRGRLLAQAALFLIAGSVYAIVQNQPSFVDPDSFYHAKMASLMTERGLVMSFPWLPFTTLADAFADHHFLYHAALMPFVWLLGPLVGTKVATVVFAAGAIVLFHAALDAYGARYPFVFSLALATAGGFILRLNLAKATALSLSAVMVALILLLRRRAAFLFVLSWLFVWLYGGWPIMLLLGLVILGTSAITGRAIEPSLRGNSREAAPRPAVPSGEARAPSRRVAGAHHHGAPGAGHLPRSEPASGESPGEPGKPRDSAPNASVAGSLPARLAPRHISRLAFGFISRLRPELRCALAIVGGLAAGLVVNPYFPENLAFYWEQIVQVVLVGYAERIAVGGEWYPYAPSRLIVENGAVFLVFALAFLVLLPLAFSSRGSAAARPRPLDRDEIARILPILLLGALFLVLTLRSRRYVEYFAPFAMLGGALLVSALLRRIAVGEIVQGVRASFGKLSFVPVLVLLYLGGLFVFFAGRDVLAVRAFYRPASAESSGGKGIPWSWYSGATAWIASHTPENSIIFHSGFDEFPFLFFHDDRNRYISGLDPTFLYRKDPERYELWDRITRGELGPDSGVARVLRDRFDARTVVIGKSHESMRRLMEAGGLELVYEDREVWIYQVL